MENGKKKVKLIVRLEQIEKHYRPFVDEWDGQDEYPRKKPVPLHRDCINYDSIRGKCTRLVEEQDGVTYIKNLKADSTNVGCKFFIQKPPTLRSNCQNCIHFSIIDNACIKEYIDSKGNTCIGVKNKYKCNYFVSFS